MIKSMTKFSI